MRRDAIERNVGEATAAVDKQTSSLERHVLNVARAGEALYRARRSSTAAGSSLAPDAWQSQVAAYLTHNAESYPASSGNGLWFEPQTWDPSQIYGGYYAQLNDDGRAEFTLVYNTAGYDYLNQPWYTAALPKDWDRTQRRPESIYWAPSYYDPTGLTNFQTVDSIMYDDQDQVIGVATTDWTLREMEQVLAGLAPTEQAQAFLVDPLSNRMVVRNGAAHDKPLVQDPLAAGVDINQPVGSLRVVESQIDGGSARTFTSRTRSGLIVGVQVPEADILRPVDDLQRGVLIFIALGLLLGLLFGVVAVHRLLRPLSRLTLGVDLVGEGDLDVTVPVEGAGELRLLSHSFNRMTQQLRTLRQRQAEQVEELEQAGDALRKLATTDQLTGLANRTALAQRLEAQVARLKADPVAGFAVLFIDCDRFKMVNDSFGHLRGDQLLVQISKRLRGVLGDCGMIARFGGDEFVVLLDGATDAFEVEAMAQRVLQRIAEPCTVERNTFVVTGSIGVVMVDGHHRDQHEILRDADVAMYRAKNAGRNRVVLFERWMAEEAGAQAELESELRQACERREFIVAYQPVVSLASGRLLGFEALVRWEHPTRGLVPPIGFIGAAEDSGLIVKLGRQVLEMACQAAASWSDPNLFVAVNVSRRQLAEPRFVSDTFAVIAESGLDPSRVHIELTESLAMEDVLVESGIVHELKRRGVHISIDDFGTGYSSLAVLHTLPLDVLKIDRAFVEAAEAPRREEILRAVISLSHGLGVMSLAEGVETEQQYDLLRRLGCDAAQGYLIAKPMLEGIEDLIRTYSQRSDN